MGMYISVIVAYTVYSYNSRKEEILRNVSDKLLLVASGVKRSLPENFQDSAKNKSSLNTTEEMQNNMALSDYAKKTGVSRVYTLIKKDGKVYYTSSGSSGEQAASAIETPSFSEYTNYPAKILSAFDNSEPLYLTMIEKEYSCQAVLVPEKSPGGLRYLSCAELDISHIDAKLRKSMWTSISIASLFILLTVPFIILFRKTEKEHVEEFRNLKDMLRQKSMDRTTRIERKINEYIEKK